MSTKKLTLNIKENNRTVVIDLSTNQNEGGLTIIPLGNIFELPLKRGLFGQKLTNVGELTATIEPLDSGIKWSKGEDPLVCAIKDSEYKSTCFFSVKGETEIPFNIAINKRAFKDLENVKLDNDMKFDLLFRLDIKNKKGDSMIRGIIEDYLNIHALAIRPYPKIEYKPILNKLKYYSVVNATNDQWTHIGDLLISHNCTAQCAPDLRNVTLDISTILEGIANTFHQCFCVKPDSNPRYFISGHTIRIKQLKPTEQAIVIPLYWDMSSIATNPYTDTKYILTINDGHCTEKKGELILIRDNSTVDPDVSFKYSNEILHLHRPTREIEEYKKLETAVKMVYNNDQNAFSYCCKIEFKNLAQAQKAQESIAVWGISTNVEFVCPTDCNRLKLIQGTLQDVIEITPSEALYCLKANESHVIPITIHDEYIDNILPDTNSNVTEVKVNIKLQYKLYVDKDGKQHEAIENNNLDVLNKLCKKTYVNYITIRLMKQPSPRWMCIDFGTSAIVAGMSDREHQIEYINLKHAKDFILKNLYPNDHIRHQNSDETEPFITSTVSLNPSYFAPDSNNNKKNNKKDYRYINANPTDIGNAVQDYGCYPLLFSPGENVINREFQLPCLKTIMGYQKLPNIFNANNQQILNWTYRDGQEYPPLLTINHRGEINLSNLLEIDSIFQSIYKQLFVHFLATHINPIDNRVYRRQVNQLVLTVPNTYTPYDREKVRRIVRETMPEVYPEHLTLVSESDAVACYYLLHRNDFIENSKEIIDNTKKQKILKQENVLVFDMGAGTLDLTLFSLDYNLGITTIDYKAKMGVNKAGNYLDYVLAEVLIALYEQSITSSPEVEENVTILRNTILLNKAEANQKLVSSRNRATLKNYIKELKKHLNDPAYKVPNLKLGSDSDIKFSITSKDIINHDLFVKFIDDITNRVLKNFVTSNTSIDTVIFSGRSTELIGIRQGVHDYLNNIGATNVLYADICDKKYHEKVDYNIERHTNLKTVVSEGALAYADRFAHSDTYQFEIRANYAAYGIVTQDLQNQYHWYPLIDKCQYWDEDGIIRGMLQNIPVNNLLSIELIQTYTDNVVNDYENKKFDMISRLLEIPNPRDLYQNLNVSLEYNNQVVNGAKSAITLLLNNDPAKIQPHEDFNDENLRKSLWPVIF